MVQLRTVEAENGQAQIADEIQAQQFPTTRAAEQVIVYSPRGTLVDSGGMPAVRELVARLGHTRSVASLRSPLTPAGRGQISRDGRAALISFQIRGDPDDAQHHVAPALAVTNAVQRRFPHLFVARSASPARTGLSPG